MHGLCLRRIRQSGSVSSGAQRWAEQLHSPILGWADCRRNGLPWRAGDNPPVSWAFGLILKKANQSADWLARVVKNRYDLLSGVFQNEFERCLKRHIEKSEQNAATGKLFKGAYFYGSVHPCGRSPISGFLAYLKCDVWCRKKTIIGNATCGVLAIAHFCIALFEFSILVRRKKNNLFGQKPLYKMRFFFILAVNDGERIHS